MSNMRGTTRDAIDTDVRLPDGRGFKLIDTAGIRRRTAVAGTPHRLIISRPADLCLRPGPCFRLCARPQGASLRKQGPQEQLVLAPGNCLLCVT